MKMNKQILWLRISYRTGAIIDGLMLFPMLSPKIGGLMMGIKDFSPGPEYLYAMRIGASLMAGWTVLLLWADRKPVERKGILLITMVPVIVGLALAGVGAVANGLVGLGYMLPTWILQVCMLGLMGFSYFGAGGGIGKKKALSS
jgi:hypothetical protein